VTWHLSLLALPIILIAAYILFYVIAEPIKKLSQWAQQLSTETSPQRLASKPLHFLELQLLAEQLYSAFRAIYDSNEREKQFLRTLSHELRTPLAVTSTTLDVLAKKDDGQLRHFQPQLDRIRRANNTMQQVTDSLLWLWREPSTPLARYPTNVKCLVEQIWQTLQLHALEPSSLTLEMKPELTFHVAPALLQIVLANLLRNALSYGQPNTLIVSADAQQITVRNAVDDSKHVQGSGVGLYLVEQIAQRLAWQLTIARQNTHFVVSITF
jgi:signal transduction histidine kinase